MMKSFFKKLAFVMALAMVVSMVAPAGSALAATAGIAIQNTKSVVTEAKLEKAGDTVDFCFLGAPKDWKTTYKWTSSNEAVATVDKAGLVTAVAAGTATITITAGADVSYVHTVTVTVGPEAPAAAVAQTSEIDAKVIFDKKVSFAKDAASLYRIFDTAEGPVEVYWPINTWKLADDGMSVAFAPFVQYGDGEKYVLKVGSYEIPYTTVIGEVTHVETTYKTGNQANVAYVTPEDADEDVVTTLGVKIMSGTINLTNVYADKFDISYEFVQGAEYENASLDEDDGELTFSEKGAVIVTAVVSYEDEEGEDQVLANVMPATIVPQEIPEYEVVRVLDWTTVNPGTQSWNFSWNNKSLYAGDENYQIVLKLEDNRGNVLVTDTRGTAWNVGYVGNNDEYNKAGYAVEFYSTNTNDFLVDTDGSLATYKNTKAVIYVKLYKDNEDGESTFVKNIYALELKVDKAREITNVIFGDGCTKVDMPIDALANNKSWSFLGKWLWMGAFDQTWTNWADLPLVQDGTYEAAEFEVVATSPEKLIEEEGDAFAFVQRGNGHAQICVNSDKLFAATGKSKVSITIKETVSGKKITTTINLKKPTRVAPEDLFNADGSVKDTKYATNGVLNFNVVPSVNGQYIVLDLSKGQLDVAVSAADKSLGYDKDNDNVMNISKDAVINLYKLSNDYAVGYYFENDIKGVVTSKDWAEATSGIAVGDKYVAVVNPKGDYLDATWVSGNWWDGGTENLLVNLLSQNADGSLKYAEAGKYTVYVYSVNKVTTKDGVISDIDYVERKDTFSVSYGQSDVVCLDRIAITTEHDFGTKANPNTDNIAKIIVESFKWKLGSNDWDIDENAEVVDMDNTTYTIKGDNIIIRTVAFKVPYDGGNSLVDGEAYYIKKVAVNMAVELED